MTDLQIGGIYQHYHGGFYQIIGFYAGKESERLMVAYRHIWPYDPLHFSKDTIEFAEKFSAVDHVGVQTGIGRGRAKEWIEASKKHRATEKGRPTW